MKKSFDRFHGVSEEEIYKKDLNDVVNYNLDIIFVNINPGLYSVFKGHHYSGPGNHFYRCVYESGLTTRLIKSGEDYRLLEFRIGLMNMFEKASTKTVQDLTQDEIRQAQFNLNKKIKQFRPKIVAFNGKSIYETYIGSNVKNDFNFGKQPFFFDNSNTNIIMFVLPSSSARCSQLPKVVDKIPFYVALKKLREHLNGRFPHLTDMDVMFPDFKVALNTGGLNLQMKNEQHESDYDDHNGDGPIEDEHSHNEPSSSAKKNEHKIRFVRLNNLPYSQLPSNIVDSINEQRKSKKGITITTDRDFIFNMTKPNPAKRVKKNKSKTSSLSSDMETGSNLTFDDSLSVDHNFHNNNLDINNNNNNNNNSISNSERVSNIGSIVLNLVASGNSKNQTNNGHNQNNNHNNSNSNNNNNKNNHNHNHTANSRKINLPQSRPNFTNQAKANLVDVLEKKKTLNAANMNFNHLLPNINPQYIFIGNQAINANSLQNSQLIYQQSLSNGSATNSSNNNIQNLIVNGAIMQPIQLQSAQTSPYLQFLNGNYQIQLQQQQQQQQHAQSQAQINTNNNNNTNNSSSAHVLNNNNQTYQINNNTNINTNANNFLPSQLIYQAQPQQQQNSAISSILSDLQAVTAASAEANQQNNITSLTNFYSYLNFQIDELQPFQAQ